MMNENNEKKEVLVETIGSHEELFNSEWEKSQSNKIVEGLKEGKNLQELMESIPDIEKAFEGNLDTIDCSDERVRLGGKIGIAGSGALLSDLERQAFIDKYKGRIKVVTSHEDCGAAKIKFNQLKESGQLPEGINTSDELGSLLATSLAKDLGAEHLYLPMNKMANDVHNARMIIIDTTGKFDSSNVVELPNHFVCSGFGFGFSPEYMKAEIKTLTGIAMSDHGFGDRFTSENPFYLSVVADNAVDLMEAEKIASEVAYEFGDKVKVEKFLKESVKSEN